MTKDIGTIIRAALTATLAAGMGCEPSVEKGSSYDDGSDDSDDSAGCSPHPEYQIAIDGSPIAYAQLEVLAEHVSGWFWNTEWVELDDEGHCFLACLQAEGILEDGEDPSYVHDVELYACTWSAPTMDADGSVSCDGIRRSGPVCLGRRPLGWQELGLRPFLDGAALLEHVSIAAFEELAQQLRRLGAPGRLLERCLEAAADERRHVDLLVGLGAKRPHEHIGPSGDASIRAIALHNALEGCVSETWAALLAEYQAEAAPSTEVRRAHARIAADESRHAQLAWDLHDWLCARLSPSERRQVERARQAALGGLPERALAQTRAIPPALRARLGLPAPETARALAERFAGHLAGAA